MQSIGSDIGGASFCTYNQSSQIDGNGYVINEKRFGLNDTMPANNNNGSQASIEKNGLSNPGLNDTDDSSKKINKINIEAYQAYYNTNENSIAAGQGIAPKTIENEEEGQG